MLLALNLMVSSQALHHQKWWNLPSLHLSLEQLKYPFFAEVSFNVGEEVSYMIVAAVSWFCPHPKQPLLGKPAEVWCHDKLEHPGIHLYIPVEKIASRCAHRTRIIDSDSDSDSPC